MDPLLELDLLHDLSGLEHWQLFWLCAYFAVLSALSILASHRYLLVWRALRAEPPRRAEALAASTAGAAGSVHVPPVTVQLPLYNEAGVARRLLRAVAAFDYPRDRLQIQVLDDSTDETRAVVDELAENLRESGLEVQVRRRLDRRGYKAGALADALPHASGQLLAIFDADFVPPADFLRRLVPEFVPEQGGSAEVGLVQARWAHLNRSTSLLTEVQAVGLDGHFLVEHVARHAVGDFFNFNGTAGIWRRQAIEDAGGWKADTVTEDLDLSYRAQLAGWRFVYRGDVEAPAELPSSMAAFVAQQRRWTRGAAQTLRKLGPALLASAMPWRRRLEAFLHVGAPVAYPLLFLLALVTIPATVVRWALLHSERLVTSLMLADAFVLCVATGAVATFYAVSQLRQGRSLWQSVAFTPALIGVGMGISPSNTFAWLGGIWQRGGEFVRTPKGGEAGRQRRSYRPRASTAAGVVSVLMAVTYVWLSWNCVRFGLWSPLPFLLLYAWGFLYVGVEVLAREDVRAEPATKGPPPPPARPTSSRRVEPAPLAGVRPST